MGMHHEHINKENSEKDTHTKSNAFYVFGGLTLVSGIWSLLGNYYDPELTSIGVWILDSAIAVVGLVFIVFQYTLNRPSSPSESYSFQRNKEKIKKYSKSKSEKMPYKKINLIDLQSNKLT